MTTKADEKMIEALKEVALASLGFGENAPDENFIQKEAKELVIQAFAEAKRLSKDS